MLACSVSSPVLLLLLLPCRDALRFVDAEEAEAVYSMVALTQARGPAWQQQQGATAAAAAEVRQQLRSSSSNSIVPSGCTSVRLWRCVAAMHALAWHSVSMGRQLHAAELASL
jgi:hypothetical protein